MAQRPPPRAKPPESAKTKVTPDVTTKETAAAAAAASQTQLPSLSSSSSAAPPPSDAPSKSLPSSLSSEKSSSSISKDPKDSEAREREAKEKEARRSMRAQNLSPKRPDASFLKTLSSDIKRNTAFIRKLRLGAYSGAAGDALMSEFNGLNLSRYVSEAVAAIAEAPLKMSDLHLAVRLVSALHQRYAEFASALVPALVKHFAAVKTPEAEADKLARLTRKRVTARLLVELYEAGIYTETAPLTAVLADLSAALQGELRDKTQESFAHLPLITSFLRAAGDLLGLARPPEAPPPPDAADAALLPADVQKQMIGVAESAFESVCRALLSEHRAMRGKERENQKMLETRGELTEAASAAYDKIRKIHEKLQLGAAGLAELLNKQLPALPDDQQTTRIAAAVDAAPRPSVAEADGSGVWDDEDTRAFYESLPDLRVLVPAVLLGGGSLNEGSAGDEDGDEKKEKSNGDGGSEEVADVNNNLNNNNNNNNNTTADDANQVTPSSQPTTPAATTTTENHPTTSTTTAADASTSTNDKDDDDAVLTGSSKGVSQLDLILGRLSACANREAADALAVEFCYVNNKNSRRRLVRALHSLLPRIQMVQIPCFARLAAILSQCIKEIGAPLVTSLEGEFFRLFHKKDQSAEAVEARLRNVRFLGELCKFRVCSPNTIFHVLKLCLDEFTQQNIDVACSLIETCGRFLYKQQETHVRTANMLDLMMRRKASKALDARQDLLVENAFYLCKPAERSARVAKKQLSPLEAYVRHLLYTQLTKSTARHVLKQLRKLPWNGDAKLATETETAVLRACVKAHRAKFSHVHLVASVIAGLSAYHDQLGVRLVDLLLERIRAGLDDSDLAHLQRRVVEIKMLSELYNYCLFESALLFDVLYLLINLNPYTFQALPERADSPTEFFRLRLVCTLLDTSGSYFDRGTARRRLDRYIVYLQRYVLAKACAPPVDVSYMLSDTLEALRPNLVRCTTLEQANDAVRQLELEDARAAGVAASTSSRTAAAASTTTTFASATNAVTAAAAAAVSSSSNQDEDDEESDSESDDEGDDDDGDDEADGDEGDSGSSDSEESDSENEEPDDEDDEEVRVTRTKVTSEDADEFDKELQRVMHESYEARKAEARAVKAASSDIAVPMHLLRSSAARRTADGSVAKAAPVDKGENYQDFQVLLKKGSKQQTKTISVPLSTPLAAASKAASAAELEEQREVKRFVLEYGEREDEEAAQRQSVDQYPAGMAVQRGRGGVVRRVLHLSGGTASRIASSPEPPPQQPRSPNSSSPQRGGGSYRGGRPPRGHYHPKS